MVSNLVMTVIGFGFSITFIVFVCTRLICARIRLNAYRRSVGRSSRSDLTTLERGSHSLEHHTLANFPTKKYRELCASSKENSRCTVCLADYHEEDTLHILPICGHFFHASCIGIWLQGHSTCPVCRISLCNLPIKKSWFMRPLYSSALRSHHTTQSLDAHYNFSCCMVNGDSRPSRSRSHGDESIAIDRR